MTAWVLSLRIRAQLMITIAAAASLAIVMAGAVVAWSTFEGAHDSLLSRLQTQARITASNSAAAVEFDDQEAATRILKGLGADRAIVEAAVLRRDGSLLARAQFAADKITSADIVQVTANVMFPREIGVVRLRATTEEVDANILYQIERLGIVFIASLLIALLISARLQYLVAEPITALADAAVRVTVARDFSVRVPRQGSHELRELVDAFNSMLTQLESGRSQLLEYQAGLERQVATRTAQLGAALADAQLATRVKADFLANMSHEIRTPMNGVVGMLDLLHVQPLDGESRLLVETARNSADALLTLMNDILDFSKIEAGKLTLEKIDVQVRPLAEEVATLFTRQASAKGVEVTCAVHNDVPELLGGDPTRLRQIMVNLMGNAVKFTASGEVLLGVQLRAAGHPRQQMLQILVRDTGIGMTREACDGLFKPFTQADTSTTRKYGGTGLGLAITKKLVDAMGGSIRVLSQLGSGSTFSVFVPLDVRSSGSSGSGRLSGSRALIVDDNATNRCVLEHYLQLEGAVCESTESARAGLALSVAAARAGRAFDMVLLDWEMPDMEGVQFLRELRREAPTTHTRCVALSVLGERTDTLSDQGVAAWLVKPVRRSQLREVLERLAHGVPAVKDEQLTQLGWTSFAGTRVLLVEDNQVNQNVALRLLRTLAVETVLAENGMQALAALQSGKFDLVLMDCQMPVMDGYEATRAVRFWEAGGTGPSGAGPHIPIVAMTANALQGDREKCLAAGMDDYVAKPIKRDALAAVLSKWIANSNAADSQAGGPATGSEPIAAADGRSQIPSAPLPAGIDLDEAIFNQLAALMGDEFADLVATYCSDTPAQIAAMATALAANDRVSLTRAAHSLKSSSATLGAVKLEALARHLETWEPQADGSAATRDVIQGLHTAFAAIQPLLLRILNQRQGPARQAGMTAG